MAMSRPKSRKSVFVGASCILRPENSSYDLLWLKHVFELSHNKEATIRRIVGLLAVSLLLGAGGCAATQQATSVQKSGFMDQQTYSMMREGKRISGIVGSESAEDQGLLVYRKVVEGYLPILEDLLLSYRIPVFTKKAKRATIVHPKFFFFDAGVFRSLRPAGPLDQPQEIMGAALEGLVAQHLLAKNTLKAMPFFCIEVKSV